ncbi:serine hydrolase domain-containing protein [Sphingomonas soli]|uniref:serine hydrolase domain-containing protein n=1 Tax=Sphingomonas soli TaxID=266127 RepID=UPI0008303344|nr:serine hydrolase [Sphingomonas soli]
MTGRSVVRYLSLAAMLYGSTIAPAASAPPRPAAADASMTTLLAYLRDQNSTGFLVVQDGRILVEKNWDPPAGDRQFPLFVHGRAANGALLEDVASQQKSFVAVLAAIAVDKGLIRIEQPVSAYLGRGWSKATPDQEAKIRVLDLLQMSSGLDERFGYAAPVGASFFYNTPVYAVCKRILAAAAGQPLEVITRDWLTGPAGMNDTAWRTRPAAMAGIGNDTGLVTTPRDTAVFGQLILANGVAKNGQRIVSESGLRAMFERAPTNPAYGRLWWLNGGDYRIGALGGRQPGPLVAAAPADMVAAFGALTRRLYIVRSRKMVVVRTGAAAPDPGFDQQLWLRLNAAIR